MWRSARGKTCSRGLLPCRKSSKTNFHLKKRDSCYRLVTLAKRRGLHLSKDIQEEVKRISKLISELSIEFNKNLNEDNAFLVFSRHELDMFHEKPKPIGIKERKYIPALTKRECLMKGYQFDGQINTWDLPYCMDQVEQGNCAVNKGKLNEYFPVDVATEGLFGIYQELLGLTFTEVERAHVWHENVKLY